MGCAHFDWAMTFSPEGENALLMALRRALAERYSARDLDRCDRYDTMRFLWLVLRVVVGVDEKDCLATVERERVKLLEYLTSAGSEQREQGEREAPVGLEQAAT